MVLLLMDGLSVGQVESNATLATNVANFNNTSVSDLKYIWSVTGIENDRITMALDQGGADLFGRAKYEPEIGEPWNGEVVGLVSGNQVHLTIAALIGDKQILSILDGILADQSIGGRFFQTNEGEVLGRGEFNAVWINPDLSGYIPAKMPAIITNVTVPSDINQASQQPAPQKSRFYDVRQDADRVLTGVGDISQIPIGMSGL
jgi:hypothetical protein